MVDRHANSNAGPAATSPTDPPPMHHDVAVANESVYAREAQNLSLFVGDPFWRFLRRIRCADDSGPVPLLAAPIAIALLWLPIAVLSALAPGGSDFWAPDASYCLKVWK